MNMPACICYENCTEILDKGRSKKLILYEACHINSTTQGYFCERNHCYSFPRKERRN